MAEFSSSVRRRAIQAGHRDPDVAYRELMLDVRCGGPVSARILSAITGAPSHNRKGRQKTTVVYREPQPRNPELTPAERRVASLVCLGYTDAQIGDSLLVGEETVKTHLKAGRAKLGATNRAHLAALVVARDLFDESVAA